MITMQCCEPTCENKSNSRELGILKDPLSGRLPDDAHLRSAFLGTLGLQHAPLSDSELVCSQQFLCETDSGSQQLCTDADPSTVQVCMTCLNTERKMCLMNKHKLKEAYEILTGYPVCDGGNLTQALCVQCAHRLRHFSRFREMSLKARSLMMELVKQHELITIKNIKMLQFANNQQNNNLVTTTLGPDHCDLYIVDHSEGRQTDGEETVHEVTVKTEHGDDSPSVEEDTQVIKEEKSDTDCVKEEFDEGLIKYENAPYMCTVCYEEFHDEHAFSAHVSMHHFRSHGDATSADTAQTMFNPLCWRPVKDEDEARATQRSEHRTTIDYHPVVKLYDVMKYHKHVLKQDEALTRTRQAVSCGDSVNARTARGDAQCRAARATHDEPAASTSSAPHTAPRTRTFICDVCQHVFKQKSSLVVHMRKHTGEKPYSCDICSFKCAERGGLARHKRTHTGEKPYSCEMCCYKSAERGGLARHMRTHTGEKPFSCGICSFKGRDNTSLVDHMRTHTGEKPFSCDICNHKFTHKRTLVKHAKTHTSEKPYSCELCSFRCKENTTLVNHMRTHTGEKPYNCELCSYKSTQKTQLINHVRTHTGEKPYNCELCSYKSTQKTHLINHVRTHTGEKPYSCEICGYKFTQKSNLASHVRRTHHSGEKSSSSKKKKKKKH